MPNTLALQGVISGAGLDRSGGRVGFIVLVVAAVALYGTTVFMAVRGSLAGDRRAMGSLLLKLVCIGVSLVVWKSFNSPGDPPGLGDVAAGVMGDLWVAVLVLISLVPDATRLLAKRRDRVVPSSAASGDKPVD